MKSHDIIKTLRGQGYKKLGQGADATVWTSDGEQVIKILMPEEGKLHHAVRTFKKFYRFCQRNSENEHLPRFYTLPSGHHHEHFEFNGHKYYRIAMERLWPLRKNSVQEALVWQLSDFARTEKTWVEVKTALVDPNEWKSYDNPEIYQKIQHMKPPAWVQYHMLFLLMQLLYLAGSINKLGWDLHTENVMRRRDGTLVVVDPWFAQNI